MFSESKVLLAYTLYNNCMVVSWNVPNPLCATVYVHVYTHCTLWFNKSISNWLFVNCNSWSYQTQNVPIFRELNNNMNIYTHTHIYIYIYVWANRSVLLTRNYIFDKGDVFFSGPPWWHSSITNNDSVDWRCTLIFLSNFFNSLLVQCVFGNSRRNWRLVCFLNFLKCL